jgi:hypothetical protein
LDEPSNCGIATVCSVCIRSVSISGSDSGRISVSQQGTATGKIRIRRLRAWALLERGGKLRR